MSIGSALSSAYSGLLASSRMADIVASNVANALNENYARRSVELIADSVGGVGAGVMIGSVTRLESLATTSTRRAADAKVGYSSAMEAAYQRLVSSYGNIGDGD